MENILLLSLFLVHQSSGVIYSLNLTEYYKMPDLYEMDDYDPCLADSGGVYCLLDADLYTGDNPDLMRTIWEYSDYKRKHFNHTKIHRALCATDSCKDFIQNRSLDDFGDLYSILEECVNASIWKEYRLTARVTSISTCKKHGTKRHFSIGDYVMAAVYIILIILNTLGTFHDYLMGETSGIPYLMAFSLRRNWRKLTAPSGVGPDHRLRRLKAINSLRSLTIFGVFCTHTGLVFAYSYLKNPLYFEMIYADRIKNMLIQGPIVTYTFFMISGFLMAFNVEVQAEKHKITLWDWPKGMVLRWLRLTPVLALVLFSVMTLNRHLGDGPQWDMLVTSEAAACHQYWWAHLLYVNNYIYDDSHCLPQTWYLAADTQLFALGLLVCVTCRRARTQAAALAALAVASLAAPAAHTYFQDLDAVTYQSPEMFRTVYKTYDTFRIMYIGAHTNMSTYVVGLAGGLLTFRWFKNEKIVSEKIQKYSWMLWMIILIAFAIVLSGNFFYMDGYEPSMATKIVYASLHKPVYQVLILALLMACVFKAEGFIRSFLEWRGFTWMARVSYNAFLLHSVVQRTTFGSQRQPIYATDMYFLLILAGTALLSTAGAVILWLTVEAPLAMVVKTVFTPPREVERQAQATDEDIEKRQKGEEESKV